MAAELWGRSLAAILLYATTGVVSRGGHRSQLMVASPKNVIESLDSPRRSIMTNK